MISIRYALIGPLILIGLWVWMGLEFRAHLIEYEAVKTQVREMTLFLCRDVYQCETADGKKFP